MDFDVLKKVPVSEQDPQIRATNFDEVCLGYTKEEAVLEASRCLNCKNARCMQGCPVSINIPPGSDRIWLKAVHSDRSTGIPLSAYFIRITFRKDSPFLMTVLLIIYLANCSGIICSTINSKG